MIEIVSREQVDEQTTWLVAADNRGLGLEDCGCGKNIELVIAKFRGPVVEKIFVHANNEACKLAFDRNADFSPLTYENYCALFPAVEADVDEP